MERKYLGHARVRKLCIASEGSDELSDLLQAREEDQDRTLKHLRILKLTSLLLLPRSLSRSPTWTCSAATATSSSTSSAGSDPCRRVSVVLFRWTEANDLDEAFDKLIIDDLLIHDAQRSHRPFVQHSLAVVLLDLALGLSLCEMLLEGTLGPGPCTAAASSSAAPSTSSARPAASSATTLAAATTFLDRKVPERVHAVLRHG